MDIDIAWLTQHYFSPATQLCAVLGLLSCIVTAGRIGDSAKAKDYLPLAVHTFLNLAALLTAFFLYPAAFE